MIWVRTRASPLATSDHPSGASGTDCECGFDRSTERHRHLAGGVKRYVDGLGPGDRQLAARSPERGVNAPRASDLVGINTRRSRLEDADVHRAAGVAQEEMAHQPARVTAPAHEQGAAQACRAD